MINKMMQSKQDASLNKKKLEKMLEGSKGNEEMLTASTGANKSSIAFSKSDKEKCNSQTQSKDKNFNAELSTEYQKALS